MRGDRASQILGLTFLLAAFVLRRPLEARLVTHLLVQFPLLLAGGALLAGPRPPERSRAWNRGGATGLALALVVLGFWMLPRAIDAAVVSWRYELAKFVSVPVAGAALAWSLPLLPWLARQLVATQAIAMAAASGWLYLALPQRLCLRYLRSDQDELGAALLFLSAAAFVFWVGRLVCGAETKISVRTSGAALERDRCSDDDPGARASVGRATLRR
ncbi:MAG: hypothetical protein RMK73_05420 [Geminicoccaceae bacterium]|nr:hypothetical protein [Geminicoccaceae bacterium]MCS7268267.1 hypothetical protein [Geminicoccaceae bacterium]MDW8125131.1 hypothetical protein [Geminicoccaceae bacterium]MDW8340906.1 hypothetical protein [Geminicoccaceae bacterium]